ncbi:uncharacterized protein EV422DRAFT_620504 [Fimicolochytrium jonesii]|uniref:uncharacterized protein n=1 Tax=Fimicolochytrium jonesii TaxID=1396493 RepID=UPI0022FF1600|nr:uncharacterized protein EV422DRAFT_620504 [Fimicolochytrium jonesii]KAI8820101.1 hypothetical protein EV422DRAFT_620504 [Fimicolochytrium jonesii]
MADDFDIYAELDGDEHDLLYGDLAAKPDENVKAEGTSADMEVHVEIPKAYSDEIDYGEDEMLDSVPPRTESSATPAMAKSEPESSVQNEQDSGIPGLGHEAKADPARQHDFPTHTSGALPPQNLPGGGSRALLVSELSWWTTDDDIKLAISEAGVTEQLLANELSFSEHRVNGKSKGICYIPFQTQEATALAKEFFETIEIHGRKPIVKYVPPSQQSNPFRTLPKDPKETRAEQAKRGPAIGTGAGVVPSMPTLPLNMGAAGAEMAGALGTMSIGRGSNAARGRSTFQQHGFGPGAPAAAGFMGPAAPGFYNPDFYPSGPMMGAGPFPDDFRSGFGRGGGAPVPGPNAAGMRGGPGVGGRGGNSGFPPVPPPFFDGRNAPPFGPDGPFFDGHGPDFGFDYQAGGMYPPRSGGAPSGRGFARPFPPNHSRGPGGGRDGGRGDQSADDPRGSLHHDRRASTEMGHSRDDERSRIKAEPGSDSRTGGSNSATRGGDVKSPVDRQGSLGSVAGGSVSGRHEDRDGPADEWSARRGGSATSRPGYGHNSDRYRDRDERVRERDGSREKERRDRSRDRDRDRVRDRERERDGGRERDREREKEKEKDRRSSGGAAVFVKERGVDDTPTRDRDRDRDRDGGSRSGRSQGNSRERQRSRSRDRERERDRGSRRSKSRPTTPLGNPAVSERAEGATIDMAAEQLERRGGRTPSPPSRGDRSPSVHREDDDDATSRKRKRPRSPAAKLEDLTSAPGDTNGDTTKPAHDTTDADAVENGATTTTTAAEASTSSKRRKSSKSSSRRHSSSHHHRSSRSSRTEKDKEKDRDRDRDRDRDKDRERDKDKESSSRRDKDRDRERDRDADRERERGEKKERRERERERERGRER